MYVGMIFPTLTNHHYNLPNFDYQWSPPLAEATNPDPLKTYTVHSSQKDTEKPKKRFRDKVHYSSKKIIDFQL